MPKHGSINLYVHGSQKARYDGQPRTATSTLTQLLNYVTESFRSSAVYTVEQSVKPHVFHPNHDLPVLDYVALI